MIDAAETAVVGNGTRKEKPPRVVSSVQENLWSTFGTIGYEAYLAWVLSLSDKAD